MSGEARILGLMEAKWRAEEAVQRWHGSVPAGVAATAVEAAEPRLRRLVVDEAVAALERAGMAEAAQVVRREVG